MDFSTSDVLASFFCVVCLLALLWLSWLYYLTYRRNLVLERDNFRLIRRLGRYHSITLGPDDGYSDPLAPAPRLEPLIPPFFRHRRPSPPPSPKKG